MAIARYLILSIPVVLTACVSDEFRDVEWKNSLEPEMVEVILKNDFGQTMRVLAQPEYRNIATKTLDELQWVLDTLPSRLMIHEQDVQWWTVVFSKHETFHPTVLKSVIAWSMPSELVTAQDAAGLERSALTEIFHEQVHRAQQVLYGDAARRVRWFVEGMAEWTSVSLLAERYSSLYRERRELNERRFQRLDGSARLAAWGGVEIKSEAILRQLDESERQLYLNNPAAFQDRNFRFGPSDFAQDNAIQEERYGAAFLLFDNIAEACGGTLELLQVLSRMDLTRFDTPAVATYLGDTCGYNVAINLQ